MKKFLLPTLIIPSLLTLTACGGGDEPAITGQSLPTPTFESPINAGTTDDELNQKIQKAQNELNEINSRLASLFASLDQANQSTTNQADETLKSENGTLTAKVDELTKAKESLENQKTQLEAQKNELENQKTKLESQIDTKSKEVDLAKQTLESAKQDLENQKASLEQQIASLNSQNQADKEALSAKQQELEAKQKALDTATQALAQKQSELDDTKQALNALKAQTAPPTSTPTGGIQDPAPQTPPRPSTPKQEPTSLRDALSTLKASYTEPDRGEYTGFIVTVDNKAKTAQSQVIDPIAAGDPSEYFKIDGIAITLLGDGEDEVILRELKETDFSGDGFNGATSGFVGSKHGTGSWDGFSAMRFGLYNDKNNKSHLFVYGNPAKIDKAKNLSHKTFYGSAIIGKDGTYQKLEKAVVANIGSDDTKVNITIKTPKEELNFAGDIIADSQGYKTTFGGELDGNKVQGGFFGSNNVVDIGGIFEVNKEGSLHQGEHGVFGASSDGSLYRKYK